MKSHTTILAIVFGFLILHFFYPSKIILFILIFISGFSLLSINFSIWIEKLWFFLSRILSFIIPNIILIIVFYLLLTPLSLLSKIFNSKTDYKSKNDSKTNFIKSNKNFNKESFKRAW